MITIKTVNGGWLIIEPENDYHPENTFPVEIQDGESTAAAFARALWLVDSLIGPSSSRYDAERIQISIEPGDKYEDGRDTTHHDNLGDLSGGTMFVPGVD